MDTKASILIVDDDPMVTRTLSGVLSARGYAHVAAGTGKEALDSIEDEAPAVALIDLVLEDMSGLEVMAEIKKRCPGTECIVLTGYASQASAIEAVNLGAFSYVQKPYDMEQLLVTIDRAVEKGKLKRYRDYLEKLVEQRTAEVTRVIEELQKEIAERERVQEALRQSEEELQAIFDGVMDGIIVIDQTGKIMRTNRYVQEAGGFTEDELVGKRVAVLEMVPPQSMAKILSAFDKLEKGQDAPPYEIEVHVKDGEKRISEVHSSLVKQRGRVVGIVGVMRDITERKQAEEEIRQRNQELAALNYQLSLLLEANKAASSSLDHEDVLATMAEKLTELAKVTCCRIALLDDSREKLIVRSAYPIVELPDWEPRLSQQYSLAAAPLHQKVIDTGEPLVWTKDDSPALSDTERAVSLGAGVRAVALLPVILKGQVMGVVSLGERRGWERSPLDTAKINLCRALVNEMVMAIENARLYEETVQRAEQIARAEQHLASVVESANDLVVSMDSEGRIMTWNRTAEQLSGFTLEEVAGKHLAHLGHKEHRTDMEAMLAQVARGQQARGTEMNLITKAGQRIPIAWNCSLMRDDGNHILGIVAIGRDLTERRRLEAQLIQSAKMASLGVMAGGIAHEIRNPLSVTSAAAQLFLESPDDEELRAECAEEIYSEIRRVSIIIENLLRFARPSEGHKTPVDINEALEDTLLLLRYQMTRQRIAWETELSPQLPPVMGNKNLLQQVFSNMILNACNAMPDGGRLTIETHLNADREVEIRFTDTGCGIPEENLDRIFDPFFTTMPAGKGTGLGLSICYAIVEQHRGEIDVYSDIGVGSTFVTRLPVIGS